MSWNKNTVVESELDATVKTLAALDFPHELTVLGTVQDLGISDNAPLPCRRLAYKDLVMLERMERTHDCDTDDYLTSHTFKKEHEPKTWKLEIYLEEKNEN